MRGIFTGNYDTTKIKAESAHFAAVVERTEHQRFGADGLGLFQQRFGQLPHLFATTVKGVDRVNRQDLDVVARRQLAHLLMAQIVGHFSAG